ncbi:MAG: FKBP-type peptidyl-prolyl cis-trans isomerase [Thermoanaerobaculia bacterium]
MEQAKRGDLVHVHYTGSLEDGSIFDTSEEGDPISLTIGAGEVIPGFEDALVGMATGETKRVTIPEAEAYGPHRSDLVFTVDRDAIGPEAAELEVDDMLQVGFGDGGTAQVQVTALTTDQVTLDANHPMSGKTLIFDLELMSIGTAPLS